MFYAFQTWEYAPPSKSKAEEQYEIARKLSKRRNATGGMVTDGIDWHVFMTDDAGQLYTLIVPPIGYGAIREHRQD